MRYNSRSKTCPVYPRTEFTCRSFWFMVNFRYFNDRFWESEKHESCSIMSHIYFCRIVLGNSLKCRGYCIYIRTAPVSSVLSTHSFVSLFWQLWRSNLIMCKTRKMFIYVLIICLKNLASIRLVDSEI